MAAVGSAALLPSVLHIVERAHIGRPPRHYTVAPDRVEITTEPGTDL
ncbi:hypothetical protein [Rothia nasimurium]|nr:hypothetical protein [Rothia nasimurium]